MTDINTMLLPELKKVASSLGIKGSGGMRKSDLVAAIRAQGSPAPAASAAPATSGENASEGGRGRRERRPRENTPREDAPAEATPQLPAAERDGVASRLEALRAEGGRRRRGDRTPASETTGEQSQNNQGERRERAPQQQDRSGGQQQSNNAQNNNNQQNNTHQGAGSQGGNSTGSDRYQGDDDDFGGRSRNRRRRNRDRSTRGNNNQRRQGGNAALERLEVDTVVTEDDVLVTVSGILDVLDSYAFVRTSGYLPGNNDAYVSLAMVRKYGLRKGDVIVGQLRQPREGERKEKFNPLVRLDLVNGDDPANAKDRPEFNKLTPLYPQDRLRLETTSTNMTGRIVDLVAPIGKGQRGLIVSPPKAGKTMVMQSIANAISENNPEVHLMVVLVDERPEEVTDFQRSVKGEVIASTFDRPADDHTTIAELAIERAKRLVELGHDVVVLLDGITRLSRAYNLAAPASGRILSGGVDSAALYPPKKFFGAARNVEHGGSLTILATALVETGSKMDEVIFEEFKGTGNMELRLRRELADKRIFPAIDAVASGTRREEQLMTREELAIMWKLRRVLSGLDDQQALEMLINRLKKTATNLEFLHVISRTAPTPE